MNSRMKAIALLVGAVWLLSCSGGSSKNESVSGGDLSHKTVRVVFDLPGDDIGSVESQKVLQEIKDEIQEKRIATVTSSGFGMGTMEIVLRYQDGGSMDELRGLIGRIFPKARYRVDTSSN